MATDRQQRLDDLAAANARADKIIKQAEKYKEGRERRKIRAALQSFDPSVSKEAMEEAFLAQPQEEQDAAMMARGGFPFEGDSGEARELEPSRMKGKVGYPDLGEEGTWGASARAARLQVTADAAKKIRADLAAEGNKYGKVQRPDQTNSEFAAEIEVAKNEAAVNLARETSAATTGGTKRGRIGPRSDAALGYMATVGLDSNIREHFAERDENGKIRTDENGEIVDRIDQDTGMPEWRAFLASDAVFNELDELSKKYEEYIGVFGRKPKMLDGTPENMDDIREGRGGRSDLDDRGAAISRLQAEIDREKAEQEDDRKVDLAREMNKLPNKVITQLDELRKAYHAEGADQQAILGNTALLLGKETGTFVAKEQAEAFLESGILAGGEVGAGVKPPTETAAERNSRRTYQGVLTRLDELLDESDKHDWTGVIPSLNAIVKDEFLPVFGIDKYANFERASFRSTASVTAWNLVRSLNEEGRLSDKDAAYLFPLVPTVKDEKPEFRAKLSAIKSLVIDKLQLQAAGAGRTDAFSLDPVTLLKSVDQPSAEFGGVVQIPHKYAMSVIGNMPQYKFIGEDKTKPVTFGYIMGQPDLTDKQKRMWILGADIPLPRR
jgi:hypothetical protein